MDLNKRIKQRIVKAAKAKAESMTTRGVRQTHGELPDNGTQDVKITKENICFSKWLRGNLWKNWTDAQEELAISKSMNERFGTEGGFLVPTQISTELIELLKSQTVVRNMPGVRVIPMTSNAMDMGRVDTGPTVTWGGENTTIAEDTALAFGKVMLVLKKAVCKYECSRELIADASVGVDVLIKQELADALALAEDLAFLEGTGGTQPQGLYGHPEINNTDLSGAFEWDQISEAMYEVERQNGMVTGWIGHPRVKYTLRTFKDSNGNYLYQNNVVTGNGQMDTLAGTPFKFSTQMGITYKIEATEGWMVGGQWSNFMIGEKSGEGIRIEATDTGGDAFADDQVHIKAVRRVDSALRHPETFVRIIGLQK